MTMVVVSEPEANGTSYPERSTAPWAAPQLGVGYRRDGRYHGHSCTLHEEVDPRIGGFCAKRSAG